MRAAAFATIGAAGAAEGWLAHRLLLAPQEMAELLPLHAAVAAALALCGALLHRAGERDPLLLLFVVSVAFLGPVGVLGTAVAALFRRIFARRAKPFAEWYASLFPAEEPDPTRSLYERVVLRGHGPALRSTVAPFADVMRLGSLAEKQAAIGLIAGSFRPDFAPALRTALNDPEAVVRVQAAAAVARIEDHFLQRAMALEERHAEAPDDPAGMLALARHYDEQAATGLLDEGRARETAERALRLYLQCAQPGSPPRSRPETVEAIGRLLLRLDRAGEAARLLAPVAKAAGAPPGILAAYLESLFRLRRMVELRDMCRRIEAERQPAFAAELREAVRLWSGGAEAMLAPRPA